MAVTSTPVLDEPLLTVVAKSNSFSGISLSLDGDEIFKGSLIPGYQIIAGAGNSGTLVLTISKK